jgi:hypothetical protein
MVKSGNLFRSHTFAASEDFNAEVDIKSALKSTVENIRISVKESIGY